MRKAFIWMPVIAVFFAGMAFGDPNYLTHKDLIFPQVAAGGVSPSPNYETWITLTNRGTTIYQGALKLYTGTGSAWNPYVNGTQITGGSLDLSIPAGATVTLKVTRPGGTEAGYAVIRANSRDTLTNFLEGNLTYFVDSTADSVGVAPSRPFYVSTLPFEDFETICLALANTSPDGQPASITLELYSRNGNLAGTQVVNLQSGAYTAQYLWQLFGSVDRSFGRGRLQISSNVQISGVALTQISNGQLSSLPLNSTVVPYSLSVSGSLTVSGQSFVPESITLWTEGASFIHGALVVRYGGSPLRYFMYGSASDGILQLVGATNNTSFIMIINVSNFQDLEQGIVNGQVTLLVPSNGSVQTATFNAARVN